MKKSKAKKTHKRQTELQRLILQFTPELKEAQTRVKELKGKHSIALRRAQASKPKIRGKYGRVFSFADIKNQKQLNREIVRIRAFLAEESSKVKNLPKRRNSYWEEFNVGGKKTYSEDVYRLYRTLQERFGGEERFKAIMDEYESSKGKYDSETVLEGIDYDFSNGMSIEDIMSKYEGIFEEMENSYKGLIENEE